MGTTTLPAALYPSNSARTQGELKQFLEDQLQVIREMPGSVASGALTIASGAITPSVAINSVDTEGSAASDDLANIVADNMAEGRMIILHSANSARAVTLKNAAGGAGQVHTSNGADYVMNATSKMIVLVREGSDWYEVCRSSASEDYILIVDQKTAGTNGGTSTQDSWVQRNMSSPPVVDETGSVTVSSNRFTLPAGTYRYRVSAPARGGDTYGRQMLRFAIDPTGVPTYKYGQTDGLDLSQQTRTSMVGQFTLTASTACEVQHYVTDARTSDGYGEAVNNGAPEIYTVVELWKTA